MRSTCASIAPCYPLSSRSASGARRLHLLRGRPPLPDDSIRPRRRCHGLAPRGLDGSAARGRRGADRRGPRARYAGGYAGGGGTLEIVAATGATPRLIGEFRGAAAISEALVATAASLPRGPAPVIARVAAERIDRMVVTLAARPAAGPRAVLLLAAGWAIDETTLAELTQARHGNPAPRWAESLAGGARALAASGWVPIVLGWRGKLSPRRGPEARPRCRSGRAVTRGSPIRC